MCRDEESVQELETKTDQVCMCVCVCVCEREGKRYARDRLQRLQALDVENKTSLP